MFHRYIVAAFASLLLISMIGCDSAAPVTTPNSDAAHAHSPSDVLTWRHKNIRPTINGKREYEVTLGYHGIHFHSGDSIEPAVAVTKNGEDYTEAKCTVRLALLDPKDATNIIKELPDKLELIFEPKTEEEPAHYAQAKLFIPAEAKVQCKVIYSVELEPGQSLDRQVIVLLGR